MEIDSFLSDLADYWELIEETYQEHNVEEFNALEKEKCNGKPVVCNFGIYAVFFLSI